MATFASWARLFKGQSLQQAAFCQQTIPPQMVDAACMAAGHRWRRCFWTPTRMLWTFLIQVLHPDCSCRAAVAMALAEQAAEGDDPGMSADPSAYSQARGRLPTSVLHHCLHVAAQTVRDAAGEGYLWCGRRVWLVDGTSCSMPDTPSLQRAFGQPSGQQPGCGFPVATLTGLFCWASGALLDVAIGPYRDSELRLWRKLWTWLHPGDVIVGDRFYCTYYDLANVVRRGCDAVCRLHQRRKVDWRTGRQLGPNDRLMRWERPAKHVRGRTVSLRQWRQLPETLDVRLVRATVGTPGFRTRKIIVATTLLDPVAYPAADIVALYGDRWTVELRLRDIKTTLGMDILRGKSPSMVRKEIYMHLVAYNLIRQLMVCAAIAHGRDLHRLSFAGTVQHVDAVLPYLHLYVGTSRGRQLVQLLLKWIAHDTVPDRPGRVEPRAVKRRPKQYALLNKPREQMRKELVS